MRIFGIAPPSPNTLWSGLVSASTIEAVLRVPARFVRSGPTSPPLPFTTWQSPHVPLPQKICSPTAASPAAGASMAVPRSPRMYAATFQMASSGSTARDGGICVPGTPFLIASKICASVACAYRRAGAPSAGPISPAAPSGPWHDVHVWLKNSRPSSIAFAFPRKGLAGGCAVTVRLATTIVRASAAARRRVIGISSWQRKREDVGAGRNGNVLLSVNRVADRRRGNQIAGVEMPERFAGARLEGADLAFVLSGKHQPARRRQHARPVVERADLLIVPDLLARRAIERAHVELPRFLGLRAFEIAAGG